MVEFSEESLFFIILSGESLTVRSSDRFTPD